MDVPFEDIEIITVVINEFIDNFYNFKEDKSYFPVTTDKNENTEDIRKFLIEHELGRRIANMLLKEVYTWKNGMDARELIARFLTSYLFICLSIRLKKTNSLIKCCILMN